MARDRVFIVEWKAGRIVCHARDEEEIARIAKAYVEKIELRITEREMPEPAGAEK